MASLDSTIRIPSDVLYRDLEGEAVILDLKTGTYFGLNEVGTRMWALLAEHGQARPAYDRMLDEYDVPAEQLEHDLLALISDLAERNLLQVDNA